MLRQTALSSLVLLLLLAPQAALAQDTANPKEQGDTKEASAETSPSTVVLELVDGRTYTGTLISRTDGKVVLETQAGERVVVPEGAVASLRDEATGQAPVALGEDDTQDSWRIGMSLIGANAGVFVGIMCAGFGASNQSPEATALGVLATPVLAGLGAWGAASFYDDRATPTGAIIGSTLGGFAGLGISVSAFALQPNSDTTAALFVGLTLTGLISGAVIGNELELQLNDLEELRLGVAPGADGGATLMMSGRF